MDVPLWKIKTQMCDIGHRIWQRGYCAGNEGNHSVRIDKDRILCTPSGVSKGFLSPEDLCVTDLEGEQVEPNAKSYKRTSEILLHVAIYKKRADVGAVVHSHPPHATAFAIADIKLPEGIHPEAEIFLGHVPLAKFAMPSTQALPESVVELVGPETNTVLMGNHGTVSFSKDLVDAYYKLEILDNYCRILLLCQQLGKANVLSRDNITGLLEVKQKFGLTDDRLACAPEGCVGQENDGFFTTFDVHPMTATCSSDGGRVMTQRLATTEKPLDETTVSLLVSAITEQIMAQK